MSQITYQKISLFDAPQYSIIVHACNSQGVWGSGIAKPFKEKYPNAFEDYRAFCMGHNAMHGSAVGYGSFTYAFDKPHTVGYIITSHDYADQKDSPELIKAQTTLALKDLMHKIETDESWYKDEEIVIYSNKFNSGLFNVPWADSALILETVIKQHPRIKWVVCDPEM